MKNRGTAKTIVPWQGIGHAGETRRVGREEFLRDRTTRIRQTGCVSGERKAGAVNEAYDPLAGGAAACGTAVRVASRIASG